MRSFEHEANTAIIPPIKIDVLNVVLGSFISLNYFGGQEMFLFHQ